MNGFARPQKIADFIRRLQRSSARDWKESRIVINENMAGAHQPLQSLRPLAHSDRTVAPGFAGPESS